MKAGRGTSGGTSGRIGNSSRRRGRAISRKKKRRQQVSQMSPDKWQDLLHPWQRDLLASSKTDIGRKDPALVDTGTTAPKQRTTRSRRGTIAVDHRRDPTSSTRGRRVDPEQSAVSKKLPDTNACPENTPEMDESQVPRRAPGVKIGTIGRGRQSPETTPPAEEANPADDGECEASDSDNGEMWAWAPEEHASPYPPGDAAAGEEFDGDDRSDGDGDDENGWEWQPTPPYDTPQTRAPTESREKESKESLASRAAASPQEEEVCSDSTVIRSSRDDGGRSVGASSCSGPVVVSLRSISEIHSLHATERQTLALAIDVERTRQQANLMRRRRRPVDNARAVTYAQ